MPDPFLSQNWSTGIFQQSEPCFSRRKTIHRLGILIFISFVASGLVLYFSANGRQNFMLSFPLWRKYEAAQSTLRNTIISSSEAYVITLPRRQDRRQQMEILRKSLDVHWTYVDAIESEDEVVGRTMQNVRIVRQQAMSALDETTHGNGTRPTILELPFRWPDYIHAKSTSTKTMDALAVDPSDSLITEVSGHVPDSGPLTCASKDFTIVPYTRNIAQYKILTRARIACWISHMNLIRRIVKADEPGVSIILEDDVDMEKDVKTRLAELWEGLPRDWDIVFLGHCWSNESHYPPLKSTSIDDSTNTFLSNEVTAHISYLHPSHGPKCTHAYALSRVGARRLLLHLTHPPFAYSRAIDQAFAWLVKSHRLKSYSIVPSVVVQRKIERSDVTEGKGSGWNEGLYDGVFGPA